MDTVMTLTAYGKYSGDGINAAVGVINAMDDMLDPDNEGSYTSLINNAEGKDVIVTPQVNEMLSTALNVYNLSGGALDLSVYPLYEAWGEFKDETGRIKAGISHPEFKTALTYWAKWYQEGILSPDFMNFDVNGMNEEVVTGRAAFQPYYQWQVWLNGPNLVAAQGSNDAYMIPLQFPTVDGSQVLGQIGFPNADVIVVSKDCKNPAAVMKLLSYTDYIMFDPNTVLTEEQFKGFTDGQREHLPGAFEILDPMADMIQFEHVSEAIKTGDTSKLFTSGMKKKYGDSMSWINDHNTGGLGAFCQQGFDGCSYYNAKYLLDNGFTKKTDMWGPAPEAFDETVNTIDIITTGVAEIIMGYQPVEYFDQVLADWYANGGQLMEDAVNAEYNK